MMVNPNLSPLMNTEKYKDKTGKRNSINDLDENFSFKLKATLEESIAPFPLRRDPPISFAERVDKELRKVPTVADNNFQYGLINNTKSSHSITN